MKKRKKYILFYIIAIVVFLFLSGYLLIRQSQEATLSQSEKFKQYEDAKLNKDYDTLQKLTYDILTDNTLFSLLSKEQKFWMYNNWAVLKSLDMKMIDAIQLYEEALKYVSGTKATVIKLNLASLYREIGEYSTSYNLIMEALKHNSKTPHPNKEINIYGIFSLAEIYWQIDNLEDLYLALKTCETLLDSLSEDVKFPFEILYDTGMILYYSSIDKEELATKHVSTIEENYDLLESKNIIELEAYAARALAYYYKATGNLDLSNSYFKELEIYAETIGSHELHYEALINRSEIANLQHQDKENFEIMRHFIQAEQNYDKMVGKQYHGILKYDIGFNQSSIHLFLYEIVISIFIIISLFILSIYLGIRLFSKNKEANHDALCDIYNRRYLDQCLRTLNSSKKSKLFPLCILMIDIDYFKRYNDHYGHQAGDEVLKTVAAILSKSVRKSDIVTRYGGEEFCIILYEVDEEKGKNVATKIIGNIAKAKIVHEYSPISSYLTLSIGLHSLLKPEQDSHFSLYEADQALYAAKVNGRNQVATSSDSH